MVYTNSPLVQYTALSPNVNNRQNARGKELNPDGKIKKITIHHCAGRLSVETIGNIFAPTSRQASSNYGIGLDGRIGMYAEEKSRAWTSSSQWNDYQAVTIEVSNSTLKPEWEVSDLCIKRLIELCVDICKRNDIPELIWTGDKNGTLTCHDLYANTTCPGPYLKSKFPYICEQVNKQLKGESSSVTESVGKDEDLVVTKGLKIELDNVNLYASSVATRRSSTKTGTFWIWGADVINGRVRITNAADRVGVKNQVTGYINVSDIPGVKDEGTKEPEPTPPVQQPTEPQPTTPVKKDSATLAEEMKLGKWGNGEERKKRLREAGYTDAEIQAAQDIVNGKSSSAPSTPAKLSTEELAKKILNGDFGNGDARKENLKKAGYTDAEIKAAQDRVNELVKGTTSSASSGTLTEGTKVRFRTPGKNEVLKWATGQTVPNWVRNRVLYVRSKPSNGKCQVSTLKVGQITGVAYTKDLVR